MDATLLLSSYETDCCKGTLDRFTGAVDSSLIWTALLFTVSAVIAIPWRRRLTQTYGPNYGKQVLMLKQMTTRSKLFDFIRLPNGRILLPPVYPMFKVYLVSPSSLPEIHSGGGDVSDILNFVYNRTESESRLRPVSLYLPPDLTYETIVSKMIGKFKQLVDVYKRQSLYSDNYYEVNDRTQ